MDCEFCLKFPAKVIRQHFTNLIPPVALCQFCQRDPGVPKSPLTIDEPIVPDLPLDSITCTTCGKRDLTNFTLHGEDVSCVECARNL